MDRKHQRKDTLYVLKRHLRRVAAQEAHIVSQNLFHTNSLSCDESIGAIESNNDRINYTIDIDNDIVCDTDFVQHENDEIFVECENRQSNRHSQSDLHQSSFNSRDELSDPTCQNENESNFHDDLAVWAVQHHITHTALRALLLMLQKHPCFSTLSLDARTHLKTPKHVDIRTVVPGSYYHFGLEKSIRQIFSTKKNININCLKIAINIDGLPLTKSSQQQFWPILGSVIPYDDVFMIGLYFGYEKPQDANNFLKDFVIEAIDICQNGLNINGRQIACRIEALICDTPAKSFVLCVKGHSGYSSCTKCTTEGEYIENRMCFPEIDAPLRSDNNFIQKTDDNYHKTNTTCSLLEIPHFKPVTNVPLDYMHLICLGCMRKLLNLWLSGKLQHRLPHTAVDEISTRLVNRIKPYIPVEFARKPRRLDCLKLWKATEYRLILLYTGPLAFKSVLKKKVYIHFMTLHVVVRILSSEGLHKHLSYAEDLIRFFIKTFIQLYGVQNISHNVGSLVHIVKDVEKFGPLDNFSAFKFENFMQTLKKDLRKAEKPLQQVVRRYIERDNFCTSTALSQSISKHCNLTSLHYDGPLLPNCHNPQYKVVKFNGMTFKAGTLTDSCCGLNCGAIVCIKNVACTKRNIYVIIGHEFLEKKDLFDVPCSSSLLDIYSVHSLSDLKSWPLKNIIKKYVQLPDGNDLLFFLLYIPTINSFYIHST
ncbi:hypothetical protein ALC62_06675 [Cyphomyrmex costatus]|uniref:DUF4218 domain-containing protein n=1 Tax=Cyphomyrmex costatus TaxID=456900 RepID=A0A151IIN0_9HYME|nr:hypothetical protein ALC62_06675 [Cyphomyrmex costatus]